MSAPVAGEYTWKSVNTGNIIRFHGPVVPQAFLDAYGNPLQRAVYEGDIWIICLPYGGVFQGSAAPPATGSFGPGYNPGPWYSEPQP